MKDDLRLDYKKLAIGAGAVAVLALSAIILQMYGSRDAEPALTDQYIPPFTAEVEQQLAESPGFQYLISYTNEGFAPNDVTIRSGERVRFTNNSAHELWVSAASDGDAARYPGPGECGQSAFDACRKIGLGEFWEFTFEESGVWGFQNNASEAHGIVRVQ